jgi:drug/metabolite transporter (DMT)-like permease
VAGIAVVLAGLASIAVAGSRTEAPSVLLGDALFLATGLLWGLYPLMLQRWSVGAMTSTIIVSVLSLAYIPVYLLLRNPQLLAVDPWVLAFHAVNQGLINVILGLWLWGHGVRVLGAAAAQRFPPLIPVVGTLSAIPLVGEWPGALQALGVTLIVSGLGLAAFGDRLFRPSPAKSLTAP